ncbi:MAG: hypothetical protein IPO29_09365 [Anaerolineae bacterium]|nr:hypothetical protein [Anaerolineae bacterium]
MSPPPQLAALAQLVPLSFPRARVKLASVTRALLLTSNTRTALLPLIMIGIARPTPCIVRFFVMASVLLRVMVCPDRLPPK